MAAQAAATWASEVHVASGSGACAANRSALYYALAITFVASELIAWDTMCKRLHTESQAINSEATKVIANA